MTRGISKRGRAVDGLLVAAAMAFVAAAADVRVPWPRRPTVAVLIDASPSTRGFAFRDVARVRAIAARFAPDATLVLEHFADGEARPVEGPIVRDRDAVRTSLPIVAADATLLFSDGRLDASAAPGRIYPVILDEPTPPDARIVSATYEGQRLVARTHNDGPPRRLRWPDGTTSDVPSGTASLAWRASLRDASAGTEGAAASRSDALPGIALDGGDAWPENDALTIGPPPASFAGERWWVGDDAPPGYRAVDAGELARVDLLAASAIVLNDVPADAVPPDAQAALAAYVRDLGGALILVGGSRAFSAGGYGGTTLDALSPLASWPPEPRRTWVVLIDASGSMAGPADGGRTKLDRAIDAAASVVAKAIPSADAIAVGTFARDVSWWPPLPTDRRLSPPAGLAANGPTNLRAAIEAVLAGPRGALATRVVLITDGQADVGEVMPLGDSLSTARVAIDWIALASPGDGALARLVAATGGRVIEGGEFPTWATAATSGLRAAQAIAARPGPIDVAWADGLASSARDANAVYARQGTAVEARAGGEVLAARWNVGLGRVAAAAFAADAPTVDRVVRRIASSPRDERFAVVWLTDRVIVDAQDGNGPMNGLKVLLHRFEVAGTDVVQTAPGRYEALLPGGPATVAIVADGAVIDARTLAARYPPEFAAIGVDRVALDALAASTGGRTMVEGGPPTPVVARRAVPLRPWLLGVAVACVAAPLVLARLRR